MKKIFAAIGLMFVFLSSHAVQVTGTLKVTGGYIASSAPVNGAIDIAANTLSIGPSAIFGQATTFLVSELLAPGTHTRSYTTTSGATLTRTATIPTGEVGGYLVIQTYGTWYQVFNAWTVSPDGTTFTPVDFPGNTLIGGPLNGRRANLDFSPPTPTMSLSIDAAGGTVQECTTPDGATVAVSSNVTIVGNTSLDRVDWYLDNVFAGSGTALDLMLPIGMHVIRAEGIASDGVTSDSGQINVEVRDTTSPALEIQFLNNQGQQVTTASLGNYSVHFVVSDACDPAPVVTASAKPVMDVSEGDAIVINSVTDVQLPTTAVEVTATARDANGRSGMASATLMIQ
ncbi:MAG: hypothetical protein HY941_07380 [Gammaproteobacteria bacterium]|nr:hypothetical protein [Gammaproteobacteria bacterium]